MKTVAIFLAGQQGDIMSALSVMKYRNEIFGECKVVWYSAKENFDLFKYQDIEVREFPRGFGYPEMVVEENRKLIAIGKEPIWEDWKPLVDEKNHMNLDLKKNYPSLADIDYGYFPAPHQMLPQKMHGIDYPNCSRKVFGVPDDYEWHPVLNFSDQEKQAAYDFINQLPEGKKILFETFAGSSQSILSEAMITDAMNLCREKWTDCVFIFASHKYLRGNEAFPENFFNQQGVYSCAKFTVRQCALISDYCQLIISVSSGVTVACSRWNSFKIPILQFCGSFICSTKSLASDRHFELVTADNKSIEQSKKEFEITLSVLLNTYQ